MIIQSIKSSLSSCGNALYRVFISPLTACFHRVLGHPTVTAYDEIPSLIDHKMTVTYDEFEKAVNTTAWISCFYEKEATINHAAENLSYALEDLAKNLNQIVHNRNDRYFVQAQADHISKAVQYAAREDLPQESKEAIITGLEKLVPFGSYLVCYQRQRLRDVTGAKEIVQSESQADLTFQQVQDILDLRRALMGQISQLQKLPGCSSDEILLQIAKLKEKIPALPPQVQSLQDQIGRKIRNLEEIAKDIESGASQSATLQASAKLIEEELDTLLEKMNIFQNKEEREELITYLNELHLRIYPPSSLEKASSFVLGFLTQQEA